MSIEASSCVTYRPIQKTQFTNMYGRCSANKGNVDIFEQEKVYNLSKLNGELCYLKYRFLFHAEIKRFYLRRSVLTENLLTLDTLLPAFTAVSW